MNMVGAHVLMCTRKGESLSWVAREFMQPWPTRCRPTLGLNAIHCTAVDMQPCNLPCEIRLSMTGDPRCLKEAVGMALRFLCQPREQHFDRRGGHRSPPPPVNTLIRNVSQGQCSLHRDHCTLHILTVANQATVFTRLKIHESHVGCEKQSLLSLAFHNLYQCDICYGQHG